MSAPPLNDTPPIFLAVCNRLAVAALPVQLPDEPDTLPVTLPVMLAVTLLIPTIASAYTVPHFCPVEPRLNVPDEFGSILLLTSALKVTLSVPLSPRVTLPPTVRPVSYTHLTLPTKRIV